jgi:hypothetical protein
MGHSKSTLLAVASLVGLAAALLASTDAAASQRSDKEQQENKRPRLNLRAQPAFGISPARVVLTAELVGGTNDLEEYYCPTVDWEWGDDTRSESTADCPPYQKGKSDIKRRYVVEHLFKRAGTYKVYIRLKHSEKEIAATSTTVRIEPGVNQQP